MWTQGRDVPRSGTGVFITVPFAGIVRPFSFFLREVRIRIGGPELHAVHTSEMIDEARVASIQSAAAQRVKAQSHKSELPRVHGSEITAFSPTSEFFRLEPA